MEPCERSVCQGEFIMSRRVLSVGQCGPDHGSISRFLKSKFDVTIETADTIVDAMHDLRGSRYDLVLVNRKLDADYSDGSELIRLMQADPELAQVPVMLVSNYAEHQENAVALGAVAGFGKNDVGSSAAAARLEPYLGSAS